MKKFSFLTGIVLIATTATVLFLACQKENAVSPENADNNSASSERTNIIGVAGTQSIHGQISQDHAQEMAAEFAKKFPKANTTAVAYSTKDLIAYLNILVTKYKSDSVYVNFGVYNSHTAPYSSAIGRTTVFFMGKNMKTLTGNVKSQSADEDLSTSNYLNGGNTVP